MIAPELFETAQEVQAFFDSQQWRFCFIGGIAVLRWGQARVTRDVDLTLLTGFRDEEQFIDAMLGHYPPRSTDAAQFALRRRVLLLNSPKGIGIDVSLGGLPFEHLVVERATAYEFVPGITLRTALPKT